jgi:hypothetical protein
MSGRRRVQRSVRLTVAASLVCIAAGVVVAAVVLSAAVAAAAVLAAVAGLAAVRIMATEVVQSRRVTSRSRADQALAFGHAMAGLRAQHSEAIDEMAVCLVQRDRSIRDLNGKLRAAQARVESAQELADTESQRADDAQARLSEVLDAVLAQHVTKAEPVEPGDAWDVDDSHGLPTVVDMLAWEERSSASRTELPRRHA